MKQASIQKSKENQIYALKPGLEIGLPQNETAACPQLDQAFTVPVVDGLSGAVHPH